MPMNFEIVTDSSCNLVEDMIDEFGLHILPLTFMVDGEQYQSYLKGQHTDLKQFYTMMRDGKVITTSLPNLAESEALMRGLLEQGRDILTRCLYGGRLSLLMGFLPVALATIVGSILGIISGYFGKAYAQIIMRTLDIFYAFPSILLAIALSSVLGSGLSSIIIPIAVILVPPIARVAESTVQDIMPEDFIEAAQTSGASPLKVIVFFIIPNTFGRIFIYCTTQFSVSILSASGLSFLGLGISPPTPEWGSMLNALRQQIYINPLITIIPGLFIFVTALSVNIISDGLKDAMEANS